MSVLVVVEHDRGAMADASLEAFAFARSIADQLGEHVEALLIGDCRGGPRWRVRGARRDGMSPRSGCGRLRPRVVRRCRFGCCRSVVSEWNCGVRHGPWQRGAGACGGRVGCAIRGELPRGENRRRVGDDSCAVGWLAERGGSPGVVDADGLGRAPRC